MRRGARGFVVIGLALLLVFSWAIPAAAAGTSASIELDQVNRINQHRATHGRSALPRSACITNIARQWSITMATQLGNIDHNDDLGSQLSSSCANNWGEAAENVGKGPRSVAVFNAFLDSPGHHQHIDDSKWDFMGVGGYVDNSGAVWITQIFVDCPGCGSPWTTPPSDSGLIDKPIVGDWDGNGTVTTGFARGNTWYLDNNNDGDPDVIFAYGTSSALKLVGDWDGNGTYTPGVVFGNEWHLNNGFDGTADIIFNYGTSSAFKLVGDWDGNGSFTPGVVFGNEWHLNNGFDGTADLVFSYGSASHTKIAGDWDGNGTFTPGVVISPNAWHLNNGFDGTADLVFSYGSASHTKIPGDWDGNGTFTPGAVSIITFLLNNSYDGTADFSVEW